MDKEHSYPVYTSDQLQEMISGKLFPESMIADYVEGRTNPFTRGELIQLRRGVRYSGAISDTQENRMNLAVKMTCYQIIAYRQGWSFDPDNYQVRFVDPGSFGRDARIYQFEKGANTIRNDLFPLSKNDMAGFYIDERLGANRMDDDDADDLGARIIKMFPN